MDILYLALLSISDGSFFVSPSKALSCPVNKMESPPPRPFPDAQSRYATFKSHFEPTPVAADAVRRAYRLSCCKDKSKAYVITIIEGEAENQIIKQVFSIDWQKGYPLWVKSEKMTKRKISNLKMQKLMAMLSRSFASKSSLFTPGLSGHFWLENPLAKEPMVMDLYSERFEGEDEFLMAISKYAPYLPEMPGAYYIQKPVKIPTND